MARTDSQISAITGCAEAACRNLAGLPANHPAIAPSIAAIDKLMALYPNKPIARWRGGRFEAFK